MTSPLDRLSCATIQVEPKVKTKPIRILKDSPLYAAEDYLNDDEYWADRMSYGHTTALELYNYRINWNKR